jgi:hypothetical protein
MKQNQIKKGKRKNKKKTEKEPKVWCGGNNFIMFDIDFLSTTCQVHTHLLTPPHYPPPIQFTLL